MPALLAVTLPIIIQLFNRNKSKKVKFSAVRFLKVLENKKVKQLKLYQILLLVVRALIILFIVLTFARPTLNSGIGSSSNTPSTAVILLDDSYSMSSYASSKTYMEQANSILPHILKAYGPNDKVYLIKMCTTEAHKIDQSGSLQNISFRTGNALANPQRVLMMADSLMGLFHNVTNDLFILSDFKLSKNTSLDSLKNLANANRYMFNVSGQDALLDLSIDSVAAENQIFELGRPITFTAFLRNHGPQKTLETTIDLFSGKKRVGRQTVSLLAGQTVKAQISFTPEQSGLINLRFQIKEDDLPANNKYYYTLDIPQKIPLLFINADGNPDLSNGLTVLNTNTLFDIALTDFSSAASYDFSLYRLIVLRGGEPLPATLIGKINNFAKNGGHLLYIPGANDTAENLDQIFRSLKVKWRVLSRTKLTENSFISLDMTATPSFWGNVFLEKNKFSVPPEFFSYFKIRPRKDVLVKYSNGEGFFFKSGSLYLLGSSLEHSSGTLLENPLFVPLLYRVFYIAAMGRRLHLPAIVVGEPLHFLHGSHTAANTFQLLTPSKQKITLLTTQRTGAVYLDGGTALEPGFYDLLKDNRRVQSIAVNLSNKEFQPPYLKPEKLGKVISDKTPLAQTIHQAHVGSEFWFYLILIVLILVGLEMILVKKIEGTQF